MGVEEAVHHTLINDPELTAMVPGERIRLAGDDRGMQMPYIVHEPVVDRYEPVFEETGRRWVGIYQVSIFARTTAQARAIADRVVTVVTGMRVPGVRLLAVGRTWSAGHEPDSYHQVVVEFAGAG